MHYMADDRVLTLQHWPADMMTLTSQDDDNTSHLLPLMPPLPCSNSCLCLQEIWAPLFLPSAPYKSLALYLAEHDLQCHEACIDSDDTRGTARGRDLEQQDTVQLLTGLDLDEWTTSSDVTTVVSLHEDPPWWK